MPGTNSPRARRNSVPWRAAAVFPTELVEPRLSTFVIDAEEAESLNQVVQVHSREAIYYRTDRPALIDDFRAAEHLRYASSRNVVEAILHDMPGVPDRDASLDVLEDMMLAR